MNQLTVAASAVVVALLLMLSLNVSAVVSESSIQAQRLPPGRRAQKRPAKARVDYTQFSHHTHVEKEKQACDSCHKFPTDNWKDVRQGEAAFPDVAEFPRHETCLGCHRQQFFARERPAPAICSNCHVKATPQDTARFLFPSLGDVSDSTKARRNNPSEFVVNFAHETHIELVGTNQKRRTPFVAVSWTQKPAEDASKSCAVCHQTYQPQGDSDQEYVTKPPADLGDGFWLKKGAFKTSPNSHTGCFSCHNVDAGITPAPSDCNTCHKLPAPNAALKKDFDPALIKTMNVADHTISTTWSKRVSSGTYRHEGGAHPEIGCVNCHNPATMITSDTKALVVPVRSCGGAEGCHITATTDDGGALNYEVDQKKASASFVCTKCHLDFGKQRLPESHVKAIATLPKP